MGMSTKMSGGASTLTSMATPLSAGVSQAGHVPTVPTHETKGSPEAGTTNSAGAKHIYYWEPKSLRISMINWYHVFVAVYLHRIYHLAVIALAATIVYRLLTSKFHGIIDVFKLIVADPCAREGVAIVVVVLAYVMQMKPGVYCLENEVFTPPASWQVSHDDLNNIMKATGSFDENTLEFLSRVLDRSGTGESTHWPPVFHPAKDGETKPVSSVAVARAEAEAVIFPLVRDILKKSGLRARDIDFLIVNCSIFTPTPSLCAMIAHEFKFRADIRSYNLGGMGCSANVISVDLARQLLENSPGTRALVISTENLTQNLYHGADKSMLLQNTLFRAGGCAQLLSTRRIESLRAKYKLLYTGRTQMTDDDSYKCVFEQEDSAGHRGVALSKDIVNVAGRAMKHNFVQLGPHVLPIREMVKIVCNRGIIASASWLSSIGFTTLKAPRFYTPNFAKGINHFCIHAGGRAVIDGVQKNLNLQERHVLPSKQTLHDWGNTSSSSIWYEAEWIERFGNLRRGDRILQVAFGSGFKCNSAVWITLRVDRSKQGVPIKVCHRNRNVEESTESVVEVVDKAA
eukprot:TRINITY_DN6268_c0_g2_i1.p1 TRINITY_DN6268_c0_g2~~TRINITY_DN6268_c0_g2_i1.p1  ORF type:complete len:571 (-),score=84.06 TRINITY_DN6268_c0_g2_i1:151-1863(-)